MKQFFLRMYYGILNRFAHEPFSEEDIMGTQYARKCSRTEALAFLYSKPSAEETKEVLTRFPTFHDNPHRIAAHVRMLRELAAYVARRKAQIAMCKPRPEDHYDLVEGPGITIC